MVEDFRIDAELTLSCALSNEGKDSKFFSFGFEAMTPSISSHTHSF